VPRPFHVLATQNPLEQEGTYPLPEAQLDRFLLQIDVSYPDAAAERRMLFATTGVEDRVLKTILSADELMIAQRLVRQLPVGDQVVDAILKLVRSARPGTGIDQELDDMIEALDSEIDTFEVKTLMRGEDDFRDAQVEIAAGAGGTEAQDWASMLVRMYTRWAERRGFEIELLDGAAS